MKRECLVFLSYIAITTSLSAQDYSDSKNIRFELTIHPTEIIYVDDDNTAGPWNGSAQHPYQNIPEGLAAADSGHTVCVKPGTYPIMQDQQVNEGITLFLDTSVVIQFDANIGMTVSGKLKAMGTVNDSILFTGNTTTSTWKGIRFFNSPDGSELRYCRIEHCLHPGLGGAIYMVRSSPKLFGCLIQNCQAAYGAAVFCDTLSSPEMNSCVILDNSASLGGGGIVSHFSTPLIINNYLIGNHSSGDKGGGGILACNDSLGSYFPLSPDSSAINDLPDVKSKTDRIALIKILNSPPGGILSNETGKVKSDEVKNDQATSIRQNHLPLRTGKPDTSALSFGMGTQTEPFYKIIPVIKSNTIINNVSAGDGGGCRILKSRVKLYDNNLEANIGENGGAIYVSESDTVEMAWNRFKNNHAIDCGGSLYLINSDSVVISRNLFTENYAAIAAGAFLNNTNSVFYNNTLWGNAVTSTPSSLFCLNGNNNLFNNILWGNSASGNSHISGNGVTVAYNDIEGGFAGQSNFSIDPMFVDTTSENFHLQFNSPCINTGMPGFEPDPDSTIADRGVYYLHTNVNTTPLSGTYTINPEFNSNDRNFKNFTHAVITLGNNGISGPVCFLVSPATYTEQIVIPSITGASEINTITFQSLMADSTSVILTCAGKSSSNYVVKLDGADYTILKKITIKSASSDYGRVIEFANGSHNNFILNNRIIGLQTTNTSVDFSLIYSGGSIDNDNVFQQNVLQYGSYGICYSGNGISNEETGTKILNNTFSNQIYRSIHLEYQNAPFISGNIISSFLSGFNTGIYLNYCDNQLLLTKNKVATSGTGISIYNSNATSSNRGLAANNFVMAGGGGTGFEEYSSNFQSICYNSINITGYNTSSKGFYLSNSSNNYLFNNIFANHATGYAVYLSSGSGNSIDYNDLFTTGPVLSYYSSSYPDLPAWRTGTGFDIHSVSSDPSFVSSSDLHIPCDPTINNAGYAMSQVTEDIDGQLRDHSNPDIGADEFAMCPVDASITWLSPVAPVSPGYQAIGVVLKNMGINVIDSALIAYTDGISIIHQLFKNLNLPTGSTDTIFFSTKYQISGVAFINAYIGKINGISDGYQKNDTTATQIFNGPLSGTYSINPATPTWGTNFSSFSAVLKALTKYGISGPVNFMIVPGTYYGQIVIPPIAGTSVINTITFQSLTGDSTSVTLTFPCTSASNFVIKLDGGDNIIFRKVTIQATGDNYGTGVNITNGANNNQFLNNKIAGIQTLSTSANLALIYSGTTSDNNNIFKQNCLQGGSYGLYYQGVSSGNPESGTQILNNLFSDQSYDGIRADYQNGLIISGNVISSSINNYYTAIYLNYCNNQLQVIKNNITVATGTYCLYLNYCSGTSSNRGLIANNFMSMNGLGIYCYYCNFQNIHYNNINITGNNLSGYAISIYSSSNNNLKNNIFANHAGGNAISLSGGSGNSIDYNDLYSNGPNLAGSYATLQAWIAGTGFDIHSVSVEPNFLSYSNLHINNNPVLNRAGTPVSQVTDDIDGEPRNLAKPDIGADEFIPSVLDASIIWLSPLPPVTSGLKTISVIIANTGATLIDSLELAFTDGVTLVNQTFSNLNLASETSDTLNFLTQYSFSGISFIRAYISKVNGIQDYYQLNDTTQTYIFQGPLSGTYTIDPALPTLGTNFKSFSLAATALGKNGISGPVNFLISPASYNEQVVLPQITGASATNTITFRSSTGDSTSVILTWAGTGSANYVLKLDGSDYTVFRNMTIKSTGNNYGTCVLITNGANYNQFMNNRLVGVATTSSSDSYALIFSGATSDNNNTFKQNSFYLGSYGIVYTGVSSSNLESGIQILDNHFYDQYLSGITVYYQNGIIISGNIVSSFSSSLYYYGIYLSYCKYLVQVKKNKINTTSPLSTGIYFTDCSGTSASRGIIVNNFINAQERGVLIGYSTYQNIYYNSINLKGTSSAALYMSSSSNCNVRNNIFANHGGGFSCNIYSSTSGTSFDYNDLYSTGTILVSYYNNNTYYFSELSAWSSATGFDLHSVSVDPNYVSSGDLHINFNPTLNRAGTAIPQLTDDIDGDARNAIRPDIGADEYPTSGMDASITWLSPIGPVNSGLKTISVIVTNNGATTIDSIGIAYTDGFTTVEQSFSNLNLLSESSDTIAFSTQYSLTGLALLKGYLTNINGGQDDFNSNDTTMIQYFPGPLAGTYYINPTQPTLGNNFNSFSVAFNFLAKYGIAGPVNFLVSPGTYYGQLVIPQVTGVSATNTITFQSQTGDSTSVILTFPSNNTNNYVIKLDGADYTIIKNMTIRSTGTSYGGVILLTNGANYNQILNNCIVGVQNSSSYSDYALIISGTTSDNYNIFRQNVFQWGSYGLYYQGVSSGTLESGTQVLNNFFYDQSYTGIDLEYQNGAIVSGNIISSVSSVFGRALLLYYCNNLLQVLKNKISIATGFGIYLYYCSGTSSNKGLTANNFVFSDRIGLYSYSCNYQNIYYNSVKVATNTTSYTSYAILFESSSSYCDVKNNIFFNNTGGYSIYVSSASNLTFDYNDLFTSGSALCYQSGSYSTLPAWRAATGYDLHSVSATPNFLSSLDFHILNNPFINRAGIPVSQVTTDIDGELRNIAQPDIGADEFNVGTDAAVTWLSPVPPVPQGLQTIMVKIENSGTTMIDSLSLAYTDGLNTTIQVFGGLNLSIGTTDTLSFTTPYNVSGIAFLFAYVKTVNGIADNCRSNDTTTIIKVIPSPLSGTYSINKALPTAGVNFNSFTHALNALISVGISGPVTFLVSPGTYSEQLTIPQITGTSSTNTVTFQALNNDSTSVLLTYPSNAGGNFVVYLNGADYFTFSKMTLQSTGTSYCGVVQIANNANYNQFLNNRIVGIQTTNTSLNYALVYSGGFLDNGNNFSQNLIQNGSYGLYFLGVSSSSLETGTQIRKNIFSNQYNRGIDIEYQDSPQLVQNAINSNSTYSSYYGLYAYCANNQMQISKNKFYRVVYIYNSSGTSSVRGLIASNFFTRGVAFDFCNYLDILNNSVNITGNNSSSTAFRLYYSLNNVIKNNIFSNNATGYAIYTDNSANNIIDNNDLFTTGLNVGSTYYNYFRSLPLWQTGTGFDIHSVSLDPGFVSSDDLHIPINLQLNGAGIPFNQVTDDIDGQPRNSVKPDIGADEIVPENLDAGITWLSPVSPYSQGIQTISVLLENNGTTTIDSLDLAYSDGVITNHQVYSNLNFATNGFDTLTFSTPYNYSDATVVYAFITKVNGVTDDYQMNDTTEKQIYSSPLGGTYTINPALPTRNSNFTSFTDAVTALKSNGINGPVTFMVYPATYNERIIIPQITGSSGTNTIIFQSMNGDSTSVILNYQSTPSLPYTLILDGTDYCTFRTMTIKSSGTSNGGVIRIMNNANNNQFLSNRILGVQTTNNTTDFSLIFSGNTIDNDNVFNGNLFMDGSYGLYLTGYSTSSIETETQIMNNSFSNQSTAAVYLTYQDSPQINRNSISSNSTYSSFIAINLGSCNNQSQVINNKISISEGKGISLSNSNGTSTLKGLVANNFINVSGTYCSSSGIYCYKSNYQNYYFNSINNKGNNTCSYSFQNESSLYFELKNNIIANHAGGYALYNSGTSDYNDLFTTGSTLVYMSYYGYSYPNLAAYQSAYGLDLHSVSVEPNFISPADLHIVSNPSLYAAATPVAQVTYDIDEQARNVTNPDIGADEFQQTAIVTTANPSTITNTGAISGGNVTITGNTPVTAKGVCFGTNVNPAISGNHTTDGAGTGTFTSILTGLNANTLYHVRAYATNSSGTYYGTDIQFTTLCNAISGFPFQEGFEEGGALPSCWTQEQVNNSGITWKFKQGGINGNPVGPHGGSYNARLNDETSSDNKTRLITPSLNLSLSANPVLSFWHTQTVWYPDQDQLTVYYRDSSQGSWIQLATYTGNIQTWTKETIPLPNPSSDYAIAFEGNAKYGYGVCLDDVRVETGSSSSSVTVTSPNGGEQWIRGTSHNITWDDNIAEPVKIDLYKGSNWNSAITASAPSNGTYQWTIPIDQTAGNDYKIRISSTPDTTITDLSDAAFTILASTITITPAMLTFGNVAVGSNSNPQSYIVTGNNLISDISVTAPAGFSLATSVSGPWSGGMTLPQSGGVVNKTLFAKFSPVNPISYWGNITHTSTGAGTQSVAISGTGFNQVFPYIENFELFNLNDYLALTNPVWWSTWDNQPGTNQDALIKNTYSHSSSRSVLVNVTSDVSSDVILKLGNRTNGFYQLKWWMFVENDHAAYFNIQHFESPGLEPAFEVFFLQNGTGLLYAGGTTPNNFTYPKATWFEVKQLINLESDDIKLYVNGNLIREWPFSYQSLQTIGTLQLGSAVFYAHSGTGEPPAYYFDDVYFNEILPLPAQLPLVWETVANGQTICYNATQTITVAGNGSSFIVQSGGNATMIAGQKISYLPNTTVYAGGHLHGYITANGQYCSTIKVAATDSSFISMPDPTLAGKPEYGNFFSIYPNPTNGNITIELKGKDVADEIHVEIYSMQGVKIMAGKFAGKRKYDISLDMQRSGIYIVHVNKGTLSGTAKVMKTGSY